MQTTADPAESPPGESEDRLGELPLAIRSDLHVSRQMQQGKAVYVVHDPVSFRTHRLTLENYQLLVRLNPAENLGSNFQTLVRQGHLSTDDREYFYQFALHLHQLGMIVLPVANGAKLYEQHGRQMAAKKRGRLQSILFLRVPLAHPDAFLARTAPRVKWLFHSAFVAVWALAGLLALYLIGSRFAEFMQPVNSLLATENLPFLWLSFVVLKVWHELGHGYACRIHGGAVPEMGMLLIVGTPAAYVDATAAWSFPERWKRLVVMLGGMYFETLVAIPAVFVWAFSNSPMLSSCAYQLVMMASLITVLFNANPLMKYDGYFIAGELLGIQNLRSRADKQVQAIFKTCCLNLPFKPAAADLRTQCILAIYGILASMYKTVLVLSIAMMIALKFPLIGLAIAALHLTTSLGGAWWKLARYLFRDPEVQPVRMRAAAIGVCVLIVVPALIFVLPMPFGVVSNGVVAASTEHYLNAEMPGEFTALNAAPGDDVDDSQPVLILTNPDVEAEFRLSKARLQEAVLARDILFARDRIQALQMEPRIQQLKRELLESQRRFATLQITSPGSGLLARILPESQRGQFVSSGETVGIVVDGQPVLRTWLTEDQLGGVACESGQLVEYRLAGRSETTYTARLLNIEPAAETGRLNQALTFVAGGDILLDPQTGRPVQPLFQVDFEPQEQQILRLADHGTRLSLQLPRNGQTIAEWVTHRITRFVQKTLTAI